MTSSSFSKSISIAKSSNILLTLSKALKYAFTITDGCIFYSINGFDDLIISPVIHITEVVPSPTSSSYILANSIKDLAAGCLQSISLKIACPSFVITIPPIGSINIFIIDLGPKVVVIISAMAFAANIFAI